MTVQLSVPVRNARLDAIRRTIGPFPRLRLLTGPPPPSCASPSSGSLIAEYLLSGEWIAPTGDAEWSLANLPLSALAVIDGTVGHYRYYDTAGEVCHMQGTAGAAADDLPPDLVVEPAEVRAEQPVTISAWGMA